VVKEMNESRDSRPQIIRQAEDSRVPDVPTKPPPARMTFSPSFTCGQSICYGSPFVAATAPVAACSMRRATA
jgi:hypothetical protein